MRDRQRANTETLARISAGIAHGRNGGSKEAWMATASRPVSHHELDEAGHPDRPDDAERARCLEVLAASLVHEINQPLSTLVANAETCLQMLSAHSLNIQAAHDAALRSMRDAKRVAAVVERMWSLFAKTEANGEPVDLNATAEAALLLSMPKLQQRGVSVRRELEPNLPRITGDSLQLQQVILNLVLNAAEAMDEIHDRPRELVVRTQRGEGHVRLSVRDAGKGFEPQTADRLFDAFYTTKADGIGVGLFVSRWIVENHRGAISALPNDGPGATFSFSIPC
jgi:signal transduction histidine kinase